MAVEQDLFIWSHLVLSLQSSFHHCSTIIYQHSNEVCDRPDQAAHYHTFSPKLGASPLTRHWVCLFSHHDDDDDDHINGVRLCLWTVATNGSNCPFSRWYM